MNFAEYITNTARSGSKTDPSSCFIQPKLSINSPNDQYEKEANEVADKLMKTPFAQTGQATHMLKSEKPGEGKSIKNNVEHSGGSGKPLPNELRRFYEPKLGYDLSNVRIHTDSVAAKSAQSINSLAYTVGNNIVFDQGQYSPGTGHGKKILAHELAHVVQQKTQSNVPAIQRLVRTSRVNNCAPDNPYVAERRAVQFLTHAIETVQQAIANREADPADADVVAVRNALWTAFRFGNTDRAWNERLPVILRRMEAVRDYIESVVFQYECCPVGACPASTCGLTCDSPDNAFMCDNSAVLIVICPHFWTIDNNERGRTIAHEVFHLTFGFIGDWDQPDFHNAHCYAQFMLLLNGINPPPARRCH
jgi:hypothetical protein